MTGGAFNVELEYTALGPGDMRFRTHIQHMTWEFTTHLNVSATVLQLHAPNTVVSRTCCGPRIISRCRVQITV